MNHVQKEQLKESAKKAVDDIDRFCLIAGQIRKTATIFDPKAGDTTREMLQSYHSEFAILEARARRWLDKLAIPVKLSDYADDLINQPMPDVPEVLAFLLKIPEMLAEQVQEDQKIFDFPYGKLGERIFRDRSMPSVFGKPYGDSVQELAKALAGTPADDDPFGDRSRETPVAEDLVGNQPGVRRFFVPMLGTEYAQDDAVPVVQDWLNFVFFSQYERLRVLRVHIDGVGPFAGFRRGEMFGFVLDPDHMTEANRHVFYSFIEHPLQVKITRMFDSLIAQHHLAKGGAPH